MNAYEITDSPKLQRAIYAGSLLGMGVLLFYTAFWNLRSCRGGTAADTAMLIIGAALAVIGFAWWLLPVRAPRALLKANHVGLYLSEHIPPRQNENPLYAPWPCVGTAALEFSGDIWHLKIPIAIPEHDRVRLRNRAGGFARGAGGFVDFMVPVPTKRKGHQALAALDLLRQHPAPAPTGQATRTL